MRIDKAVSRTERPAENVAGTHGRKHGGDFGARKHSRLLQAKGGLTRQIGPQVLDMRLAGGGEKIAVRLVSGRKPGQLLETGEKRNRMEGHADVHLGRELRTHSAHALAGGPETGVRLPLQHENVLAALPGEMIGDARPDN